MRQYLIDKLITVRFDNFKWRITFEPDVDVELQFHDIFYMHHSGLVDIFVFAQNLWC